MSLTDTTYSRELEIAGRLARAGGGMAMGYRSDDIEVELKNGDEPVTVADRAVSDLIVGGLTAAFPTDVVISEESPDDSNRTSHDRVWFIDPIDGTKEFIAGNSGFCILIGLAINAKPMVGVIYHPVSQELVVAADGAGAWFLPTGKDPIRLATSKTTDLADSRVVTTQNNSQQDREGDSPVLSISKRDRVGAIGLKLAMVAAGDRDLFYNPTSRCSLWDTCAPEVILRESGGRITDISGNELRYDVEEIRHQSGLLASNSHLHDAAIARAAPMIS